MITAGKKDRCDWSDGHVSQLCELRAPVPPDFHFIAPVITQQLFGHDFFPCEDLHILTNKKGFISRLCQATTMATYIEVSLKACPRLLMRKLIFQRRHIQS